MNQNGSLTSSGVPRISVRGGGNSSNLTSQCQRDVIIPIHKTWRHIVNVTSYCQILYHSSLGNLKQWELKKCRHLALRRRSVKYSVKISVCTAKKRHIFHFSSFKRRFRVIRCWNFARSMIDRSLQVGNEINFACLTLGNWSKLNIACMEARTLICKITF